jgi:hypothetical protein
VIGVSHEKDGKQEHDDTGIGWLCFTVPIMTVKKGN